MVIRRAQDYELPAVALLLRELHEAEHSPETEVTGNFARLLGYLRGAEDTVVFVAVDNKVFGCLLVRFQQIEGVGCSAIAEGFVVKGGSPISAAWKLMAAAANEIERRGVPNVFILMSRHTRVQRSAYRAMGFSRIGEQDERVFYQADIQNIQAALARRVKRFQ